jgi:hypothetical protein
VSGNAGSATNQPATESGDSEPAVSSSHWLICTSPTDEGSCATGPAGGALTVPADAQGKYLRFNVTWSNGITTRSETSDASGQVSAAPAPAPTVLDLSGLKLPKKASAKGIVKATGKFKINSIALPCPAGGAACKFTWTFTAKVKGKSKKLGSSTQTVAAGLTQPLTGKFSSSGLKLLKSNKKLKVAIAMKGSGGGAGKATFKEFTVTK